MWACLRRVGSLQYKVDQLTDPTPSAWVATASREWSIPLAIAALVLVVAGGIMHPEWAGQQGSRYALITAIWEQGTVVLDDYTDLLNRDLAVRDGVTYSDKAPGQPFLAVPFYGVYRMAGGTPMTASNSYDLGLWWVSFWTAAVPGAVLAFLMFRWAREIEPSKAVAATVTMSLGTLLLVYSSILYGHVLAALLAFSMFLVVRRPRLTRSQLMGAGLLGGVAVLVEYPVALIVAVAFLGALVRHRVRALWVVVGGLPAAALLGLYTGRVSGSPFTLTYQWDAFSGPREGMGSLFDKFVGPNVGRISHVLFSQRGLLIATPVVICGIVGLVLMWRRGWRFDSVVAGASFAAMLFVQFSWSNSYAGGAGPRYVTPALPFLVAGLAAAWARWRLITPVLAGLSITTMVAATLTRPEVPTELDIGLRHWLTILFQGDAAPPVWVHLWGSRGWWVFLATVAIPVWLLFRSVRPLPSTGVTVAEPVLEVTASRAAATEVAV